MTTEKKKKADLKTYQGRPRIYCPVPGTNGILRLFIWDAGKGEYLPPPRGKIYLARRYDISSLGEKQRVSQYFETLEEARTWQARLDQTISTLNTGEYSGAMVSGPKFSEVMEEWKKRKYPSLAEGTRVHYEQLLRCHFSPLLATPVRSITPSVVDNWIAELKESLGKTRQSRNRKSFHHELTLLGVILRYYEEYHEDKDFRFPIRRRHREDTKLKRRFDEGSKDLSVEEFLRFREKLCLEKNGEVLAVLATVQYFQALRISEAAALHWEDVRFDFRSPQQSRLIISRHLEFSRTKGAKSKVSPGFKNSHVLGGSKELPLFPEAFEVLRALYYVGARGLVFQHSKGTFFEYRMIQKAYNNAFRSAHLPYRSTHVMRHGGCRRVYNETGDLGLAAQILGNVSPDTVNVYAKRHKSALTQYAQTKWKKENETTRPAPSWSQLVANEEASM